MVECPVPIVLASLSERRQRILREAGYSFTVQDPGEAEDSVAAGAGPEEVACAKARAKAAHVALLLKPSRRVLVVAADTVVALGSQVLGKPLDREDAKRILRRLSGARQQVVTGLCLWPAPDGPGPVVEAVSTLVVMRPMSEGEIADYVASGEADGKAGAYAIQESGDRFVERLEGSFHNVVGFPLERFEELLPELLRKWLGLDEGKNGKRAKGKRANGERAKGKRATVKKGKRGKVTNGEMGKGEKGKSGKVKKWL